MDTRLDLETINPELILDTQNESTILTMVGLDRFNSAVPSLSTKRADLKFCT